VLSSTYLNAVFRLDELNDGAVLFSIG